MKLNKELAFVFGPHPALLWGPCAGDHMEILAIELWPPEKIAFVCRILCLGT